MLDFSSVMMGSDNTRKLIKFYREVLGKKPSREEGEWASFEIVNCTLIIGPHSEIKGKAKDPKRLILNFETKDVRGEFERIKKLGATVVAEPYEMADGAINMTFATFADPDGNYFQLMSPMSKPN